jgi:hypothetical protein
VKKSRVLVKKFKGGRIEIAASGPAARNLFTALSGVHIDPDCDTTVQVADNKK